MSHPLERLGHDFKNHDIRALLIGAFAVHAHGVSRQTFDMDFIITDSAFVDMTRLLSGLGYREVHRQETFARFQSDDPLWQDVDVMFVDPDVFEQLYQDSEPFKIGASELHVPSLEHLIALKLHAIKHQPATREAKDLHDIVSLMKKHKWSARDQRITELVEKFGPKDIITKIEILMS